MSASPSLAGRHGPPSQLWRLRDALAAAALLQFVACALPDAACFSEHVSVGLVLAAGESVSKPLDLSLGARRAALVRVPQRSSGPRKGQTGEFLSVLEITAEPQAQDSEVLALNSVIISGRAARIAALSASERSSLRAEGLRLGAPGSALCEASTPSPAKLDAAAAPRQHSDASKEQRGRCLVQCDLRPRKSPLRQHAELQPLPKPSVASAAIRVALASHWWRVPRANCAPLAQAGLDRRDSMPPAGILVRGTTAAR